MIIANLQVPEMVSLAREYCEMIERIEDVGGGSDPWLECMAQLLPRLHAAVASLRGGLSDMTLLPNGDLEARFDLYSRIRTVLGERDGYWMEYDMVGDRGGMSGSLADDLTDIYCELKMGLEMLDRNPGEHGRALGNWESGYRLHWGQHLVDAERHLYALQNRNLWVARC